MHTEHGVVCQKEMWVRHVSQLQGGFWHTQMGAEPSHHPGGGTEVMGGALCYGGSGEETEKRMRNSSSPFPVPPKEIFMGWDR